MRQRALRLAAFVTGLLLGMPPAGAPAAGSGGGGIAGSWAGWARLANDWPGHPCRYEGASDEISVRLELSPQDGRLTGSVAIDLPPGEGSGCPRLRKRYAIREVVIGEGVVSLTDSGGHEWSLTPRANGDVLQGLIAWRQGGVDQPLAEGFAFADGTRPRSRLGGEVRLEKSVAREGESRAVGDAGGEGGAGASGAPTAPSTTGLGRHLGHVGVVLGATGVGLGLLYGVNELGKGSAEEGTVTCSPRRCIVGAPGEPCFCEGNVVSGAPCGSTEAGVPIGGPCDGTSLPCEATLSCNSGICEDRFGRCPY